jgi:hypothetical protein
VHADFEVYGQTCGLATLCVYGGAPFPPQTGALKRGVDVVVGTPGRIKDHLQKGALDLKKLKYRVLDEADEMLNMGFVDDVETILGQLLLIIFGIWGWPDNGSRWLKLYEHFEEVELDGSDEKSCRGFLFRSSVPRQGRSQCCRATVQALSHAFVVS